MPSASAFSTGSASRLRRSSPDRSPSVERCAPGVSRGPPIVVGAHVQVRMRSIAGVL